MLDQLTNSDVEHAKIEVAACTRLLNNEGILGYSGHVSARLPDGETLLVQSFDAARNVLAPEDLFIINLDGDVLDGPTEGRPINELAIHSEAMRARNDVNAVFHYHPEIATLFTMVNDVDLVPMKNHAYRWASGIPTHPESWHIDSQERGRAMAETMAYHNAVMLRAHGAVLVAEDIPSLMVDAAHFEENAQAQFDAMQLGSIRPLTMEETNEFAANFKRANHASKLWRYYVGRGARSGIIPEEWAQLLTPTERA